MSDETVEVPVSELIALRDRAEGAIDGDACIPGDVFGALVARIPPPPWEPTDEMIRRYCHAQQWDSTHVSSDAADRALRRLHDAGFDLTLREDKDR